MGIRKGGIRKLSMKKFGTPIGAGPGVESEKVGFEGAGTPLPDGSFDLCFACLGLAFAFASRLCLGLCLAFLCDLFGLEGLCLTDGC
jgi:hypothetical protein